ncbi:Holliday junction branch migration protein RuvA [Microbacterium sp. STN6]|uniref:Holliday junction branch migration protein RuvA n=1 Tax=Microbacterium sp. STN6 TaxID=2995588 RepID=UPI002260F97C|nr:Holliday junction branch migration protein RuvA [Microbacterium sp. STN6]MCX7521719.1 Holliday junction branch migration protein RuvA [Microbacterium sp. STN6]
MISSLRGTVLFVTGGNAIIEVSGVGYAVQLTPQHALTLREGHTAFVLTRLVVREDSLSLFGFADREQLEVFDLLVGVSGVGPKSALGVLAALTPEQIAAAVEADDDGSFRKVSGIGPKTAKLIVVSLTGKLTAARPATPGAAAAGSALGDNVVVALIGLGWPERVAQAAVADVVAEHDEAERANVPAFLRLALARLGPGQSTVRSGS